METFYTPGFLAILATGLVLTGAFGGILAGLLGVGGGIVIVPALFWRRICQKVRSGGVRCRRLSGCFPR